MNKAVLWLNAVFCPAICALFVIAVIILQGEMHQQSSEINKQSSQIHQQASQLQQQQSEINKLHKLMGKEMNTTMTMVNTTVVEAQETMAQEVQTVDDKVSGRVLVQGAATFAILCVMVFLWHLTAHLRNMHEPIVQRKIMAVLWMTPIYAATSLLSLVLDNPVASEYLAVIKDFYEAYCIYTFLSLLIAILGRGDRAIVVDLLANRADHIKPPVSFFGFSPFFNKTKYRDNPRGKADTILYQCQFCAMQFVMLRPITSVGMAVSNQVLGHDWTWQSPQFVFLIITNISIFLAISGLVSFYHATREDLAWCNPFPKFLCIKGVVFMTFWQGMAITIIAKFVYLVEDPIGWSRRTQNFLICLEMLFFAIAHCFVFPTEEWEEGYRPRANSADAKFGDNIALGDFVKDVKLLVKTRKKHKTKRIKGSSPYEDLQMSVAGDTADTAATIDTEEVFETEESFGDNGGSFLGDNEDGQGDYIVIYRSKGQTRVLGGDGESSSLPVDLNQIQESIAHADRKLPPNTSESELL